MGEEADDLADLGLLCQILSLTHQEVEKLLGRPTRTAGDPANPTAVWTYGNQQLVVRFHQDRVQVKQLARVEASKRK